MRTGRPPQSPEIQRAKGDPRNKGARKLEAEAAASAKAAKAEVHAPAKFDVPRYLTPQARRIFTRVANELLPPNILRQTDFGALTRYAALMDRWIRACKSAGNDEGWYLAKSKHNPDGMMRRHPAVMDMLDFNSELIKLETLLGLTPLSRQSLLRGLQTLPAGARGTLFEERKDAGDGAEPEADDAPPAPASPRGFLSAKLN
jgi:P27 family predicted phage terminase small subunit